MDVIFISPYALRDKALRPIEKYLSLSKGQHISVGLYIKGKKYIIDFGGDEEALFYDIGSISKTITAQLILKLFCEKNLDINKPVSDFLPLKSGRYPTVYELITHTAGYHHLTPIEITLPKLMRHRYSHSNPYEKTGKSAIIKALQRRNNFKGGHCYGYSDFSYAILALVAESIAKKPFYLLMTDFIKKELGLQNTTITRQKDFPKAVHKGKVIPFWRWQSESPYLASGGLVSNISDMLSYVCRQIEGEADFITSSHNICHSSFNKGQSVGTCTGWHTYKNSKRLWHVGGVGTFRASVMLSRKARIGVVVLGNTKGVKSANVHYITKILYSEIKSNKIKKE